MPMLRQAFSDRLKAAMKARDSRTLGTVRLILAGLKERDIEARTLGNREPGNAGSLTDPEIARMLQGMIKQRRESIGLYEAGNRADLARQEREEIAVIESFLPRQLNEGEIEVAVRAAIAESAASSLKDMGKVMTTLRQRHAGSLDLGRAGAIVKRLLG